MSGAGELNRRINLQSQTTTTDTEGRWSGSWVTVFRPWAKIATDSGSEIQEGDQEQTVLRHTVRIRYRPGVTAAMRVTYGARVFDILSVIDPDQRHEWLDLSCQEPQANRE